MASTSRDLTKAKSNGDSMKDKTDKELKDVHIQFHGESLIIPEGITYEEAIRAIQLKEHEENIQVSIAEAIRAFPLDGAVAMHKALSEFYGWTGLRPTPGFFGDRPPQMISVEVGFNQTMQVPWGKCRVPRIDGEFSTGWTEENGLPLFQLGGEVKRKDEKHVTKIAARMREIVAKESIYKGKAIKIKFRDSDGDRIAFSPALAPKFIDVSTPVDEPVFSKTIETQLQTSLYNPIMYTDYCVKHNIPLKRGILLEGTFGTGKSLTAEKLSRVCTNHGWTFIYLEDVRDLDIALGLARLYEPALIFAEDVDATTNKRDSHLNQILNTLDGVESKGRKIMVVLTTNSLDSIHPAFVRPGRIDSIIQLVPPNAEAMVRIARQYSAKTGGGSMITGDDESLASAFRPLVGATPAFVREAVDVSKLAAIAESGAEDSLSITPENISAAVTSMMPHVRLVNPNHGLDQAAIEGIQMNSVNPLEVAGSMIVDMVAGSFLDQLTDPKTLTKAIKRQEVKARNARVAARAGNIN